MFRRLNRASLVAFAGLLAGILGLVVQWIADPAKFAKGAATFGVVFPPGIAFILVAGVLSLVTARWWWHPVFAVLISFWIVVGGALAGQLTPNLVSHNIGTVTGNVVMTLGLIAAMIAGVVSMVRGIRSTRTVLR